MTNIAILVKEFPPDVIGGTETQSMRMASELQQGTDHEVTVYTKSYPGADPHTPEFDLVRVPNWHANGFISTLTFLLVTFLYLLRDRSEIDVLHCMMIYPMGFLGYLVHTLTAIPYFAWIRGGDYYFMKKNRIKRWMIDQVFCDTLVLVQTDTIRKDVLREFPHANLQVLGNGVEVPEKTASGDSIVFVGRLKRQKGVHILLKAMENISQELIIVGGGPERRQLEMTVREKNLNVEFAGEVDPDAVQEYLLNGSVFVLPSVGGEGLPNALLEAMAVGLPVIGTDTGGVKDTIVDGKTGYVVPPGNHDILTKRLNRIVTDDRTRSRLGRAAREYVAEYHSWEHIMDELNSVYTELVSKDKKHFSHNS